MLETLDPMDITFDFEVYLDVDKALHETESEEQEICKFYLKGNCTKGSSCPFKHMKGDRAVVCKHWLRGLCKKGESCEFLHEYDLTKMPECYFYSKFGI